MPTIEDLKAQVGTDLGVSDWLSIDQDRIDAFADATLDHQFIHVDQAMAAQTPFGGTIAHGFLTLSLITYLTQQTIPAVDGTLMGVNYGLDKVRFVTPVRSGSQVRTRTTLSEISDKGPGKHLLKYDVSLEIQGEEKPALVAEWLAMIITATEDEA